MKPTVKNTTVAPTAPTPPEKTALAHLTIYADGTVDTETKRGGSMRRKTISLQDFYNSMSNEVAQVGPLMPPYCRQITTRGDQTTLVFEVPECKRLLKYQSRDNGSINQLAVFPITIMIVTLAKERDKFRMVNSLIFARPAPLRNLNDQLYCMPYHNVHTGHNICWGNTFSSESDRVTTIDEAYKFVELFFASAFNGDLTPRHRNAFMNPQTGKEVRFESHEQFLRYTTKADVFPHQILSEAGLTLARALNV